MTTGTFGGQKEVPGHPEQEPQDAGSYLTWVLGTQSGSSARAANALNPRAICPAHGVVLSSALRVCLCLYPLFE